MKKITVNTLSLNTMSVATGPDAQPRVEPQPRPGPGLRPY